MLSALVCVLFHRLPPLAFLFMDASCLRPSCARIGHVCVRTDGWSDGGGEGEGGLGVASCRWVTVSCVYRGDAIGQSAVFLTGTHHARLTAHLTGWGRVRDACTPVVMAIGMPSPNSARRDETPWRLAWLCADLIRRKWGANFGWIISYIENYRAVHFHKTFADVRLLLNRSKQRFESGLEYRVLKFLHLINQTAWANKS